MRPFCLAAFVLLLSASALIQIVPRVPFEESEGSEAGFDVAATWLGIGGRLGENVGYFVRGDFARAPSLLEAYVSYGSDDVRLVVGRQKAPVSAEFLTGAADIDFVNRARAVRQLAPGRTVGAAVNANPGGGPLRLRVGVFNATYSGAFYSPPGGPPFSGQRDRGGVLIAGRAQSAVPVGTGTLTLGANAGYNTPDASDRFQIPGSITAGGDARLRAGRVLLAAEYLVFDAPGSDLNAVNHGGYVTAGYDVTAADRVLARLDMFNKSSEILLSYNRIITRAASVQLNVVAPLDDRAEPFQTLANVQLAF